MGTMPIGIHTICYESGMVDAVDPAFLPLDVTADPQPERREMAHMLNFWRQGLHRKYSATGLLSPSFTRKTGWSGSQFIDFIRNNPGYDVWFVTPFPFWFYFSYNIWEHGDCCHPGLCEVSSQVFKAANVKVDLFDFPRSTLNTLLFCNFWAGTPKFWDRFMPFVEHILMHAEKIGRVHEQVIYGGEQKTTYFPFIAERLFTTFLVMQQGIKTRFIKYELSHMLKMSVYKIHTLMLREWAPMIDKWDAEGTYNGDRRAVFKGLTKLGILSLLQDQPTFLRMVLDV